MNKEICFNGAAPARARSASQLYHPSSARSCFNGAAPARARSGSSMLLTGKKLEWLQRGRARAGAECFHSRCTERGVMLLQRGRARAGAEC